MTPMRTRFGGLLGAAIVLVAFSPVAATASEVRLTSAPSARAFATSAPVKRAGAPVGKSNRAIGGALIPIILGIVGAIAVIAVVTNESSSRR